MGLIISATPLRVSLLGGGTDLPEWYEDHIGYVVGGTIDKFIYVIVKPRFDNKIAVGYTKQELVDSVDEIQHDLVREAAKLTKMTNGFEIKTMADIPSEGSGLGSSSALLVGLLNAFYYYQNKPQENYRLAYDAFYIERYTLGRSVGLQDHNFCAIGGKKKFSFGNAYAIENVEIPEENLFLHYTGITRNANTILSDMASSMKEKEDVYLEIAHLARDYNPKTLGTDLARAWELKKKFSKKVTNYDLDEMTKYAHKYGAAGCKILGAGGGGFLLSYVPKDAQETFIDSMEHDGFKELPFKFTNYGTRIIYNGLN